MLDVLSTNQRTELLKVVCAFAWADGQVSDEERDFISGLCESLALEAEQRGHVETWLSEPMDMSVIDLDAIPREHRHIFLDNALAVIHSDGVDKSEIEALGHFEKLLRYLLGYGAEEWDRLERQHEVWRAPMLADLQALGLGPSTSVLDVGCGVGSLVADIVPQVGDAEVAGIELHAASAEVAQRRFGERVQIHAGDLFTVLPGQFDFVVCRWVLWTLPDPERAIQRMASWLKPGGYLVSQEHLLEGLVVYPHDPAILRVRQALIASMQALGGDPWVGGRVPEFMTNSGLAVQHVNPRVQAGPPDSPVWQWIERFLFAHVDDLAGAGHLTDSEVSEFRSSWERVRQVPGATFFSTIQAMVAGRRPLDG